MPSFGYKQERRAPKLPDADDIFAELATRNVTELNDALLICQVELYTRNRTAPMFRSTKRPAVP